LQNYCKCSGGEIEGGGAGSEKEGNSKGALIFVTSFSGRC